MALRILSSAFSVIRTGLVTNSARIATSSFAVAAKSPNVDSIPTDAEQATGLEKKEIDAMMAGDMDPFNLAVNKGPPGTKDKPTLVPSMFEERLVGCICQEDATSMTWMILKKGPAQRCNCGHFFQLVPGTAHNLPDDH